MLGQNEGSGRRDRNLKRVYILEVKRLFYTLYRSGKTMVEKRTTLDGPTQNEYTVPMTDPGTLRD